MPAFVCTPTTLRALPLLSGLDDEAVSAALPLLKVRTYRAGAPITLPDTFVDGICLVVAGKVKVLRDDDRGREVILEELGEHEFFNEDGCFGVRVDGQRFEAQTACTILLVPRRLIEQYVTRSATGALLVVQSLTRRLSLTRGKIAGLALDSVYARVVDVLLQRGHEEQDEWFVDVGAELIASLVGASREMVSRVVRDLIDRGLVRRVRRQIIVSQPRLLQHYSTYGRAALGINRRPADMKPGRYSGQPRLAAASPSQREFAAANESP